MKFNWVLLGSNATNTQAANDPLRAIQWGTPRLKYKHTQAANYAPKALDSKQVQWGTPRLKCIHTQATNDVPRVANLKRGSIGYSQGQMQTHIGH